MNLKQIIEMRGMTQSELAEKLGTIPQMVTRWLNGSRGIGDKYLQPMAEILNVSAAYIAGHPEKLPVYDWDAQKTDIAPIIAETEIENYGVLYLVDHPVTGLLAVIVTDGGQLTTTDWEGEQPLTVDEIKEYKWIDNHGDPTIMLDDGLPRTLFNFQFGRGQDENDDN